LNADFNNMLLLLEDEDSMPTMAFKDTEKEQDMPAP
jgi:hypothetical protein